MAHVDIAVFTDEHDEPAVFLEHGRNAPYYQELLTKKYSEQGLRTTQLSGKHLEKSLQEHIEKEHIDVLVMILCWPFPATNAQAYKPRTIRPLLQPLPGRRAHAPA